MPQDQRKVQRERAILMTDPHLHQRLKVVAAKQGRKLTDCTNDAVSEWLRRHETSVRRHANSRNG